MRDDKCDLGGVVKRGVKVLYYYTRVHTSVLCVCHINITHNKRMHE